MKILEYYPSRAKEAIKESLLEHNPKNEKIGDLIDGLINGVGKYKRMVAALDIACKLMPDSISESLAKKIDKRDYDQLPFNMENFNFKEKIGAGAVSKVHLLESKDSKVPSFVLKTNYKDFGDVDSLLKEAKRDKADYKKIRELYRDVPNLVPEEMSMIVTARKDKRPVIATLQRFLGHDLKDVFKDYSKDELLDLLNDNTELKNDFDKFVEITQLIETEQDEVIDLLGEKNLSIMETENGPRLVFLDPHNISSTKSEDELRNKRLKNAVDYLSSVKEESMESEVAKIARN